MHEPMGYAIQSRHLMTALHFKDIRLSFRNAYGNVEGPTGDLLIDDIARRQVPAGAPQVAFCQADAFGRVTGTAARVGWSMLEVTGLPQTWVDGCNSMDEVWVPSTFNVETFRPGGVRVPIRVMPLGVDIDYFHPGITGYRPSTRFTFLSVFEWGERKAPEVLLRAFAEEFKETEDVLLLLSVANRDPLVDIQQQIDDLGLETSAPIVVMPNAKITGHQMGSLLPVGRLLRAPQPGRGLGDARAGGDGVRPAHHRHPLERSRRLPPRRRRVPAGAGPPGAGRGPLPLLRRLRVGRPRRRPAAVADAHRVREPGRGSGQGTGGGGRGGVPLDVGARRREGAPPPARVAVTHGDQPPLASPACPACGDLATGASRAVPDHEYGIAYLATYVACAPAGRCGRTRCRRRRSWPRSTRPTTTPRPAKACSDGCATRPGSVAWPR